MVLVQQESEPFIIKVDTREKPSHMWRFEKYLEANESIHIDKISQGDYTILGSEDLICIERKASVDEVINNFTSGKDRFKKEIERLKDKHRFSCVICEFAIDDVLRGTRYSRVSPNYIISSMIEIEYSHGIPFHLMDGLAELFAYRLLKKAWKINEGEKRW